MATKPRHPSLRRGKVKTKTLRRVVCEAASKPGLSDLKYEQLSLFNFLTLIVDIKYRNRYGKSIEVVNNQDRPTQLTPVKVGLDGRTRRELSDAVE